MGTGVRAPDFGPGYPSGGARIGPAWQAVWDLLADGGWHPWHEVVATVRRGHRVSVGTVEALLYAARQAGLVERDGEVGNRWSGSGSGSWLVRRAAVDG